MSAFEAAVLDRLDLLLLFAEVVARASVYGVGVALAAFLLGQLKWEFSEK